MLFTDGVERIRKVRFFSGPCTVQEIVRRAQAKGYTVLGGTEHVFVNLVDKGDGWGVLESVDKFEADIGIKLTSFPFRVTVFNNPL